MIKTFTAYTSEVDNCELAAEEVVNQLDLGKTMKKNTFGILACNYEFVLSGVAKAVCDALPFNVIGSVTTAQAVNGQEGAMLLTLMMLTSDDVTFETVLTESLKGGYAQAIEKGYKDAASALASAPAFMFALAPFMVENSGDAYAEIMTKVSGGIPCFGTMAVDDTSTFEYCYTIYNGEHYRDRMAMALVCGNVTPRFYLATISGDKILSGSALITSSDGHILKEVNEKPLIEYFENLGLRNASETSYAMTSLPFIVDYNDGTPPVSKVFVGLNEEGHAICAGAMPEGATLRIGVFDKQDVLMTTSQTMDEATKNTDASNILIYSCVARNMSLSGDMLAELELVRDKIKDKFQFMMAYSGGELCPTQINESTAVNRFHNNTFILCVF